MHAMAKAAVAAFEPFGVIHDFSELHYEWGDMLEIVFWVGPETEPSPVAIVVGPGCEAAIRTLCHGISSSEPIESLGWVFRDLSSAWRHVADRIGSRRWTEPDIHQLAFSLGCAYHVLRIAMQGRSGNGDHSRTRSGSRFERLGP